MTWQGCLAEYAEKACVEHSPIVTLICTAKEDGDEVLDTFEFGYYSCPIGRDFLLQ